MSRLTKSGEPLYVPAVPGEPGRPYSRTCPLPTCYGGSNEVPGVNCEPPATPGGNGPGSPSGPPRPDGGGSDAGSDPDAPVPVCRFITVYGEDSNGNPVPIQIFWCNQ